MLFRVIARPFLYFHYVYDPSFCALRPLGGNEFSAVSVIPIFFFQHPKFGSM